MHSTLHESFWDFSNRVYRQPEVSRLCLSLQNLYGLDVNLLLFSCWHARSRGLLPGGTLKDALEFSRLWSNNVVKPLRSARTWMKGHPESAGTHADAEVIEGFQELREQIKLLELHCEQFQENMLESLVKAPAQLLSAEIQIASAVYNLRYILEAATVRCTHTVAAALTSLVMHTLEQPADAVVQTAIVRELADN